MIERLLPGQADNGFAGHRAALWLLGLYVALKLVMAFNSIFNTAGVAAGADGIALASFGPDAAREVLTLFALTALGQLVLALIALTILVRYRALVPFIFLALLAEQVARRFIVEARALARTDAASTGTYINYAILALLAAGLVLSLLRGKRTSHAPR